MTEAEPKHEREGALPRALGAWLAPALVGVLGAACFSGALGGSFILDDWPLIANNRAVHSLGQFRAWFGTDFWNVDVAAAQLGDRLRYFRPLALASYALDWELGGGSPWVLHATNLVLHGLAAMLAFGMLRRWSGQLAPALLGALVFALHPTKAESVAWISGRPDVWLTIGIGIAAWGVARRLRREPGGLALELFGTAVAYLSKEHALVLPAFVVVESWVALGRPPLGPGVIVRLLGSALPQLCLTALYTAARAVWMPLRPFEISGLSPTTHAALACETVGRIHLLALWPGDLTMMQGMIRTGPGGPQIDTTFACFGLACSAGALGAMFALRRRWPAVSLALALWLGLLLPVANLVWSGFPNLTSPRFVYLPSIGLAWLLAELFGSLPARSRRGLQVAATVLPLALAARAVTRTNDFRSPTAFWNRELSEQPDLVIGYLFAANHERNRGRPRQALSLAALGFGISATDYSHSPARGALLVEALELAASLTPDAEQTDLRAIDHFIERLLGEQPARLDAAGLVVEVPAGAELRQKLAPRHPELLLARADIAARLGEDARALSLAQAAVKACPRCAHEWTLAAEVALRAGAPAWARAWFGGPHQRPWSAVPARQRARVERVEQLDAQIAAQRGPARLLLEVQRYLLLRLPGRAHAALLPHAQAIVLANPQVTQILAEVAARAGAEGDARALLSHLPPSEVERKLDRWSAARLQRDAPIGDRDDLEFQATLRQLLSQPPS